MLPIKFQQRKEIIKEEHTFLTEDFSQMTIEE